MRLLSFFVAEVEPRPGARLTTAPTALIVTFNQSIDPTSPSLSDIQLNQVADDGSLRWIDDAIQELGPEGDQLVLTPSQGLTPGRYRILLAKESGLLSTDGEALDVDGTEEDFQSLGDFWIEAEGVGLDDAIELDFPGPVPTSIAGTLDFEEDPGDVRLYKITLPAGHFWRLGLEVTSQRDGRMLDSALALFDAQGRPIAAAEAGRPDAPFDPYLFAGLDAGTYYIGVSGTGDLPGSLGGYDPASATPGSVAQSQAGGSFTLHMVVDPADTPISLRSMVLDEQDPSDPTPTGFTLQFSGAIRLDSPIGHLASDLSRGVEVVDQGGRTWSVLASDYLESEARLSFLFRDRLHEGHYTVRLPEHGGLVDLAGLSPIAPGELPRVLGTFSVGPGDATEDPHDLGALSPGTALAGAPLPASLNPGESTTYRVVITFPEGYLLQGRYTGGPLAIRLIGPDGVRVLDPGKPDIDDVTNHFFLLPGEYRIQLEATGSLPVHADLTLKIPSLSLEWILANGVGQGPALSLRLVAPSGSGTNPTPPDSPPSPGGDPGVPDPLTPPEVPPSTPPPPPLAPLPSQPGPVPEGTTPLDPTPSPSPGAGDVPDAGDPPGAGAVPGSPASTVVERFSPVLVVGLVGNLVGRPPPDGNSSTEIGPGTVVVGTASSPETVGFLQGFGQGPGIGTGFDPKGLPPADSLLSPESDLLPAEPIVAEMLAISEVRDRDAPRPIHLDNPILSRLGLVVRNWVETWLREGHDADLGDVGSSEGVQETTGKAGSNPEQVRQSSIVSPTAIGSATATGLALLVISRLLRRARRKWGVRVRNVGMAIQSEALAASNRGGRLP